MTPPESASMHSLLLTDALGTMRQYLVAAVDKSVIALLAGAADGLLAVTPHLSLSAVVAGQGHAPPLAVPSGVLRGRRVVIGRVVPVHGGSLAGRFPV